ncbi:hypothetical protein BDA96_10G278200 [Sorghum bicolor]|uniref:Uncharacterized protein n=1 Tax=Sorghum bicolor TaxID=4558 RepID=A0A921Q5S4_SORBI|nr:hypothetical protein BDA96_10G278200 [Sorghum bicolor]
MHSSSLLLGSIRFFRTTGYQHLKQLSAKHQAMEVTVRVLAAVAETTTPSRVRDE